MLPLRRELCKTSAIQRFGHELNGTAMHKKTNDIIRICAAAGLMLLTSLVAAASLFVKPGPDAAAIFGVIGQQQNSVNPVTVVAIKGREIVRRDELMIV